MAKHKRRDQNVINFNDLTKETPLKINRKIKVEIVPRNTAQENYVEKLNDAYNRIIFAIGPAGTGKTLLAVLKAVEMLKSGEITRIVVTRPAVSVDEQHGYLPGDLNEKMAPWTRPIFDVLEEYFSPAEIKGMMEEGVIEISPLAFMRGRTFKNAVILFDEAQNTTPSQMKMALTRIGTGCRMFVTGDLNQSDFNEKNGLYDFFRLVGDKKVGMVDICKFERKDVERDPVVANILELYGED